MHFHLLSRFIASCLCFLLILFISLHPSPAPAAAAAPGDLMRLVPGNALIAIDVRDAPALLRKWEASPFARFAADPRAAAFFRPLRDEIDSLQRRLGTDPERLWHFLGGQAVLAGIAVPGKEPIAWMVIARHNGDAEILERLRRPPAPAGSTLRRIPDAIDGVPITRLEILREELAPIPQSKPGKKHKKNKRPTLSLDDLALVQGESREGASAAPMLKRQTIEAYEEYLGPDLLIFAGAQGRPLEEALRLMKGAGGAGALANKADFVKIQDALGGGADVAVYANAGALTAAALRPEGKNNNLINPAALGLNAFRAAGAALSFKEGRLALDGALLAPPPRQGLGRILFLPEGRAPETAGLIPAEAVASFSMALPLPRLWSAVIETAQGFAPAIYALVDMQLKAFEQRSGIKLEECLAASLGGAVAGFALPGAGGEPSPTTMIALRDGAALRGTLRALLDTFSFLGGYHVEAGKGGRWPIWTIAEGAPNSPGADSGRPLAYVCVTEKWLLAGERREGIEAVLARLDGAPGASLKNQTLYQQLSGELPADRFATWVTETGGLYRLAEALLAERELPEGFGKISKKEKKSGGGEWLNTRRIPAARVWDDYFGPAAGALSRQGEAVMRLKAFFEYQK